MRFAAAVMFLSLTGCATLQEVRTADRVSQEAGLSGEEGAAKRESSEPAFRFGERIPLREESYPATVVTPDGKHATIMPPCGPTAVVVNPDGSHSIAVINGTNAIIVTP